MFRNFNYCLEKRGFPCMLKGEFPFELKNADVVPVHKKKKKKPIEHIIRTVSILPSISKIHEKLMHQQLYDYFDSILSPK